MALRTLLILLFGMAPCLAQGQDLTKYIPAEAAAGVKAPIRSVILTPELDLFPREVLSACVASPGVESRSSAL